MQANQISLEDWDGEGVWEGERNGLLIEVRWTTGEHDFHGIPHCIAAVWKPKKQPYIYSATSLHELIPQVERRFRCKASAIIGNKEHEDDRA